LASEGAGDPCGSELGTGDGEGEGLGEGLGEAEGDAARLDTLPMLNLLRAVEPASRMAAAVETADG